jgi:hypothetical protein
MANNYQINTVYVTKIVFLYEKQKLVLQQDTSLELQEIYVLGIQ